MSALVCPIFVSCLFSFLCICSFFLWLKATKRLYSLFLLFSPSVFKPLFSFSLCRYLYSLLGAVKDWLIQWAAFRFLQPCNCLIPFARVYGRLDRNHREGGRGYSSANTWGLKLWRIPSECILAGSMREVRYMYGIRDHTGDKAKKIAVAWK